MKSIIYVLLATLTIAFYSCGNKGENLVKEIDAKTDSIASISKDFAQKTFTNPESSETITGFFDDKDQLKMMTFDSYPDHVQYFYNEGLICVIHNVIGEEGVKGSESKYYYDNGKLVQYILDKEVKEITSEVEKASAEILDIAKEYRKTLAEKGKSSAQNSANSGALGFLNDFVDKPSYDVSEDERLTSRLKAIVTGEGHFSNLIAQLAYGDAIQKFNEAIVINGQARQVIDEEGNQITFVSVIVADLANNVLSVGMTDEEGNTSIFYTEAPGTKYPKQLVDWFTEDYRESLKIEAQ